MKLIFATHNQHKLQEIKLLLPKSINLVSLADINFTDDIAETAYTLTDNALLKARHIYNKYKTNCFADDSGLEVEALNGAPGVYSARYAGLQKNDADNMQKLLDELRDKSNRNACFKTVIALILNGKEYTFDGVIEGIILTEKQGDKGFGYDPLFKPNGYGITFAQMTTDEKSKISHRGLAVNKLVNFLSVNAI
ncbi:MAG TPA: non-canonical purine NTP diphosphatase [Bacteroidia bacterium]|jgi:XTP/dITP diphosphohydrolase|nr:non-canonical purine NTP diphosphatase [Bacteroidia bacterium]